MQTDGQSFLDRLAAARANGFAVRFAKISKGLGLGGSLSISEINWLYEAAFYATLCNISFNGLGGCRGQIKPGREANRVILEREFMTSRTNLWASEGWQSLPAAQKEYVKTIFLQVLVTDDNLAWQS